MLKTIATKFAHKFKSLGVCGALRWKILYWSYKITGWHIRHEEWDFVLNYLPKLHNEEQDIHVLDVGCSRTLFGHEIVRRGYKLTGIDIESPPNKIGRFEQHDITRSHFCPSQFDFIVCISVFEHIGRNGGGDRNEQIKALENMVKSLRVGGRLLLTCPTVEFAVGHIWHGFTWNDIVKMLELIPIKVRAIESTERLGQLCMAIERCE